MMLRGTNELNIGSNSNIVPSPHELLEGGGTLGCHLCQCGCCRVERCHLLQFEVGQPNLPPDGHLPHWVRHCMGRQIEYVLGHVVGHGDVCSSDRLLEGLVEICQQPLPIHRAHLQPCMNDHEHVHTNHANPAAGAVPTSSSIICSLCSCLAPPCTKLSGLVQMATLPPCPSTSSSRACKS